MHLRLTFHQTSDERFLVLTETSNSIQPHSHCATAIFDHEDRFLRRVIAANLEESVTRELVTTVLLSISQPARSRLWLDLELSQPQIAALGLAERNPAASGSQTHFNTELTRLQDFLMHAPTPFMMLSGPEHRFTFLNQAYVDLIVQTSREEVLGRTVQAVRPELKGQPFLHLLDEVYRTQVAYVGHEVPARLRRIHGEGYDVRHFDLIYHPLVGPDGTTSGILVQATDVTEKVLAREVSERREQQLFRQWEELDAIYRTSPAAMALIRAEDLVVLRLNRRQAEWMGGQSGEIVGKRMTSLPFHNPLYVALLRRVAAGEEILDYPFRDTFCTEVVPERMWRLSLSPFYTPSGEIEAIVSIAVEQFSRLEDTLKYTQTQPEPVL